MMLMIFAVVSLRLMPCQLFGSCCSPMPLKRFKSLVAYHDSKSMSSFIQKSLMRSESKSNPLGGRFIIMSVVRSVRLGACYFSYCWLLFLFLFLKVELWTLQLREVVLFPWVQISPLELTCWRPLYCDFSISLHSHYCFLQLSPFCFWNSFDRRSDGDLGTLWLISHLPSITWICFKVFTLAFRWKLKLPFSCCSPFFPLQEMSHIL